jgi:hypothetical protein
MEKWVKQEGQEGKIPEKKETTFPYQIRRLNFLVHFYHTDEAQENTNPDSVSAEVPDVCFALFCFVLF